ncbi:MAG: hypothetical protein KatS3mg111_2706 [Pirellulaceae bacterium]|nr:MAG: hypothetical protein KatS3mg111_2706 [Pirellulaceae bacterium]
MHHQRPHLFLLATVLLVPGWPAAAQPPRPVRDPHRIFQKEVVSWKELQNQNIVMQQRDYSCGAAALATVLRYYWGEDVSEADVLQTLALSLTPQALENRTKHGLSMADLKVVAERMGYDAAVGKLDSVDDLAESKVPLVVAIRLDGFDHFVVYRGIRCGHIFLADPLRGNIRLPTQQFPCLWIANAVLVVAPKGKTSSAVSRLGIRADEVPYSLMNRQVLRRNLMPTHR